MTDFWGLIALLDGVADAESAARLGDHLAGLPDTQIEAFQRRPGAAVSALGAARFAMLPVRDADDPPGAGPVPLMGDAQHTFLLAVVAAGRDVHTAACADRDAHVAGMPPDGRGSRRPVVRVAGLGHPRP